MQTVSFQGKKIGVNILMKIWIHCRGEVANEVPENVEEADLSAAVGGDASESWNPSATLQRIFFWGIYIFLK